MVVGSNVDALPGSRGDEGATEVAAPAINGDRLGNFILPERDDALERFHRALQRLQAGDDPDGKVRVLVYGASHTAADVFPGYLRAYLQDRFGDGGHGYVPLVRPSKFYRPTAVNLESSRGWKVEHAQTRDNRGDGLFGLLGASASTSKKRDYTRVIPTGIARDDGEGPAQTHYDFYYLRQPKGGRFKLSIDGKVVATISTKAKLAGAGYHSLALPGGPKRVEVQPLGDGEVRVFGMTVENDGPGVVVDTLGIGGTRASNHLKWDETLWMDNIRRRDPDLIILAYGTNESVDDDQPIEIYRRQLSEVLDRLHRASPEAACMLVGPGDFPVKDGEGGFLPRPRLTQIVAVQREVATAAGCAFWDALTFMGGEGSMVSWAASEPAMAQSDHLHLTRRGYTRMGMALGDALMFRFDSDASVSEPAPDTQLAHTDEPSGAGEATAAVNAASRL